jgi:hypothetical protein
MFSDISSYEKCFHQIPYSQCIITLEMPNSQEGSGYRPYADELITLKEAAEQSGLSYSHLRLLAREEKIWAKKLGNSWFTTALAVREYLARDRRPGPKSKKGS